MEVTGVDHVLCDADLVRLQDALQTEGRGVLDDLDLMTVLHWIGLPMIVGSLTLGLMVWRDIDIEVACSRLNPDLAFEVVRPLVSHPAIFKMSYRDWSGARTIRDLPEGHYWSLRYCRPGTEVWKLDIWLLRTGTTRRTGGHLIETLPERLTDEMRLAILRLKDFWRRQPAYRDRVLSTDIYDAVLDHHVRTLDDFDSYLRKRGKPTR